MPKLVMILLVLLLSACASFAPSIDCDTTVFHTPDFRPGGKIAVVAADTAVANSLEFSHYRERFEARLKSVGYEVVNDPSQATYLALVAYGIDNGKTAVVSTPVFGQTSGGYYIGDHYVMPSYGVVDVATQSVTTFTRAIALDIVVPGSTGAPVQTLYEGRTRSVGECPVMVEVFDEMLEAMFQAFPGANASNRSSRIRADIHC